MIDLTNHSNLKLIRFACRARRATVPNPTTITINEPVQDPKGKKRAAPESNSEGEGSSAAVSTKTKRPRTASAYSLRSKADTTANSGAMPKKRTSVLARCYSLRIGC